MATVEGCHLVGSVPLSDAAAVFRSCVDGLPGRLRRIPDGETGERWCFVMHQVAQFPESIRPEIDASALQIPKELTEEQVRECNIFVEEAHLETGYDQAAIEGYKVFKELKEKGVIPQNVRFQVSVPTLTNVIAIFVVHQYQKVVEPIYEKALFTALRNIQDNIPHEELAIQIDCAVDMFFYEEKWPGAWFSNKDHIVEIISRMANEVDADVPFGFHFCYGDLGHKHLVEPESLGASAELGEKVIKKCSRAPQWFHCPVALSAMDKLDEYFAPLKTFAPLLDQLQAELYLGLVHHDDLEGTRARIAAAGKVARKFGVATECGWGRTPPEQLANIMGICTAVSEKIPEPGYLQPLLN